MLSNRAYLAYVMGCTYWIVAIEHEAGVDISLHLDFLDACLPCLFARSERVPEPPEQALSTPSGVADIAITFVTGVWNDGEFKPPLGEVLMMEKLMSLVLAPEHPQRADFVSWRVEVANQLHGFARSDDEEGPAVLWEHLSGKAASAESPADEAIARRLNEINPDNPFLPELGL